MSHVLTVGRGKTKRQWRLTDEEFADFESRFEERELIDAPDIDASKLKFTEVKPPKDLVEKLGENVQCVHVSWK